MMGQIKRVMLKTYVLPYVKLIANGKLLYNTELNLALWDNLGGRDEMGGEREVQAGGDICIPMANSC